MKIAIRGHESRGKEVIQILESLGGVNRCVLKGNSEHSYYFISCNNNTISCCDKYYVRYKKYTLEEFEKEFPFKIGDKVTTTGTSHPKIITGITDTQWGLRYVISEIKFPDSKEMPHISQISLYKEMKEERNITLTLEKAKEWYKKGGELKEIALQAFTEKELNPLPRSWEEFATSHARMGYYISADGKPLMCASSGKLSSPHVCPSIKSAEAHLAMIQLEQLRNCWWNGWEPDWLEGNVQKYVIQKWRDKISIETTYVTHSFLSFPTYEMAKEFLECFRDLIKQAEDLI